MLNRRHYRKIGKLDCGEIAHLVKSLLHKCEYLSLISQNQINSKKAAGAMLVIPVPGSQRPWGILTSQQSLLGELQVNDKPGRLLGNNRHIHIHVGTWKKKYICHTGKTQNYGREQV